MLQVLGRLLKMPVDMFIYSLEMFAYTIRGIQQIAYQGMDQTGQGESWSTGEGQGSESAAGTVSSSPILWRRYRESC